MTDFLDDADLNLNDDDFADFDTDDFHLDEEDPIDASITSPHKTHNNHDDDDDMITSPNNQLHDDMRGGEKTGHQDAEDIDIHESVELASPVTTTETKNHPDISSSPRQSSSSSSRRHRSSARMLTSSQTAGSLVGISSSPSASPRNTATAVSSSSPGTPKNRIQQLPPTITSEKDLKSRHDQLSREESQRFANQKDPYQNGVKVTAAAAGLRRGSAATDAADSNAALASSDSTPQDDLISPSSQHSANTASSSSKRRRGGSRRSSVNSTHSTNRKRSASSSRQSRRKASASRKKRSSVNDAEIQALKANNKQLQRQLMQLSRALDNQLHRKGITMSKKALINETVSNGSASEEQINSLLKKLKMYKQSNAELKKQLYGSSSEKVVELKNALKVKRKTIKELQQEIVTLKNIQREQSKQLEVIDNGNEDVLKHHEEELRFAQGESRKYKEENGKLQAHIDKLHQQLVYYKDQAHAAHEILRKKNISVNSAKQVEQLQASLEEERKKSADLERRLTISQKALSTWKRKQFMEAKKHKQEKENLKEKIDELGGDENGAGSAYNRARQLSERRKRKSNLPGPVSPSRGNAAKKGPTKIPRANPAARRRPSMQKRAAGNTKIPKPGAAKQGGSKKEQPATKKPVEEKKSANQSPTTNSPAEKEDKSSPAASPSKKSTKDDAEEEKLGESLDFGDDLDLDEDFDVGDFDVADDIEKEMSDMQAELDAVQDDEDEDDEDEETTNEAEEEAAPKEEEKPSSGGGGDIFKPPF